MSSRYQVKFVKDNKTIYGIVESSDEKKGEFVVADAVFPISYRIRDTDLVDIPIGKFGPMPDGSMGFNDDYHYYVAEELAKAEALNARLKKPGAVVGKLFTVGVGDGYAWYVIIKVNKRTCKIEWRGFSGDRYVDQRYGYIKTVPTEDLLPFLRRFGSAGKRLFGPKTEVAAEK